MVFAIEASENTNEATLERMKRFITGSLNIYEVAPQKTHLALVGYGGRTKVSLRLDKGNDENAVKTALDSMKLIGGAPDLDVTLDYINSNVFPESAGGRKDAGKFLVILTTKKDRKITITDLPSYKILRSGGVMIYVIEDDGDLTDNIPDLELNFGSTLGESKQLAA